MSPRRPAAALLALGLAACAGPAQDAFDRGHAAAAAGDHPAAVRAFEEALAAGAHDPAVYHALGNALWRAEAPGPAAAAWARGLALAPRDADLAANLARARAAAPDRLEPPAGPGPLFVWEGLLAAGEVAGLAALAAAAGLAALAQAARRRRPVPSGAWLALVAAVALSALLAARRATPAPAVITAPEVAARSDRSPQGVTLFVLHAGAHVAVAEALPDAVRVRLPDGRTGWVDAAGQRSTDPSAPWAPVALAAATPD
jgi:tetratricopeptide (TPR) repeat protein